MALLGFDDGSYVELIAPQQPGSADSTSGWGKKMAENAGVCAWAVGSADIKDELERLSRLGIATGRARAGSRKKPDGAVLQWETATLGKGDPGATLPFLIQDHTPCSLRVQPSASVKGSEHHALPPCLRLARAGHQRAAGVWSAVGVLHWDAGDAGLAAGR